MSADLNAPSDETASGSPTASPTPATTNSPNEPQAGQPSDPQSSSDNEPAAPESQAGGEPQEAPKAGEVPTQYEPFNLPDGVTVADEDLQVFTELAQNFGLDQEGAQKLVDLHLGVAQTVQQNTVKAIEDFAETQAQGWRDEVRNDPELGKGNFEQTQAHVSSFEQFLPELGVDVDQFIKDMGSQLYHPGMVRIMRVIGQAVSEDPVGLGGNNPGAGDDGLTPAQRMYQKSGMR